MPKMVPDVWCGFIFEIICADNLEVFSAITAGFDGQQCRQYVRAALDADAVRIALYLHTRFGLLRETDMHFRAAPGIVDAMGWYEQIFIIVPQVLPTLYKRVGPRIRQRNGQILHSTLSVQLSLITIETLIKDYGVAYAILDYAIRCRPLPKIDHRRVFIHCNLATVKLYVSEYKYNVSIVTLAIASANRNPGVFRWMYTHYGFDAPWIAAKYAQNMKNLVIDVLDARFCAEFGGTVYKIYVGSNLEEAIRYIQSERPERLEKFLVDCRYTPELDRLCAKYGLDLHTHVEYILSAHMRDLPALLRKWPHLAGTQEFSNRVARIASNSNCAIFA